VSQREPHADLEEDERHGDSAREEEKVEQE
jgi:hypothetical protein